MTGQSIDYPNLFAPPAFVVQPALKPGKLPLRPEQGATIEMLPARPESEGYWAEMMSRFEDE